MNIRDRMSKYKNKICKISNNTNMSNINNNNNNNINKSRMRMMSSMTSNKMKSKIKVITKMIKIIKKTLKKENKNITMMSKKCITKIFSNNIKMSSFQINLDIIKKETQDGNNFTI